MGGLKNLALELLCAVQQSIFVYPNSLKQSLIDENRSHKSSKDVFCKSGEVFDNHRSLKSSHDNCNDHCPDGDPNPTGQKFHTGPLCKFVESFIVNQHRASYTFKSSISFKSKLLYTCVTHCSFPQNPYHIEHYENVTKLNYFNSKSPL